MRLRNVKGAATIINSSSYIVNDYRDFKGKYSTLFNNDNPIHVEIGMGKGQFIIENARRYPYINFIGIEKFDSVVVRAIQKLGEEELPNLRIIKADAEEIADIFDHEIDEIYLNFSDPWPKKRHEKRRLTSLYFLNKYDTLFKNDKRIVMKTDNRHLFEFSVISFTSYGYRIEELILDLYKEDLSLNIPTEYEERFHQAGYPIYKIVIKK